MSRSGEKTKQKFLTKLTMLFGCLSLIVIGFFAFKEAQKRHQIQANIDSLQAEADRIRGENLNIQDKIAYLGSDDYREREAKDKLSLQRPDENVVVVKPGIAKAQSVDNQTNLSVPEPVAAVPNLQKWWNYFFKN